MPDAQFLGYWKLSLEPDASYHRHALEIEEVSAEGLRGRATIDRGIGPQGRAPNPDERRHVVAFVAPPTEDEAGFRVRLYIGDLHVQIYDFDLKLKGDQMEGAVRLGRDADALAEHAALAIRTAKPERPGDPTWNELVRADQAPSGRPPASALGGP